MSPPMTFLQFSSRSGRLKPKPPIGWLRGRIEKVLDAAKAKGFRSGGNPARWRGHLDHLLPTPSKLERGHHAVMPYEDVAAFRVELGQREGGGGLASWG